MTTNRTIASSLSYISDKLFPKILPGSWYYPEAKLSVAPATLANRGSLIWESKLNTGRLKSAFPELYLIPHLHKISASTTVVLYTFPPTCPYLGQNVHLLHLFSSKFLNVVKDPV